jgi:hypothetical protein
MPVIMTPNPKKIKVFIKNGQVYEGGIEEAMGTPFNVGGYRNPSSTQGGTGTDKKDKKFS